MSELRAVYAPEQRTPRPPRQARIRLHHAGDPARVQLVPSPPRRQWAGQGGLYCTPLGVANQLGWTIRNPHAWWAVWTGGPAPADVTVSSEGRDAASHFGCGIVTVSLPYYIETSPGVGVLVKAVPNWPIDGLWPLEGLIETDWFEGSFTLNFRLTRPNAAVYLAAGAPLAQLLPYPLHWLETIGLEMAPKRPHQRRMAAVTVWNADRAALLADYPHGGFQRDGAYAAGKRHDDPAYQHPRPVRRLTLAALPDQPQPEVW
jgi:hypothetical protein